MVAWKLCWSQVTQTRHGLVIEAACSMWARQESLVGMPCRGLCSAQTDI